jgi:hypothetical protein
MDIIQKLAKSGNKVLEAAANDMSKWSQLKHNKQDLELFLQFNLVNLRFKPKNKHSMQEIVCTSNTRFIEVFSKLKKSEKKKAISTRIDGIRTKDPYSILTYNVLEGKYNTIDLTAWEIVGFISMTEENIEILDNVLNDMLKIQVIDDLDR